MRVLLIEDDSATTLADNTPQDCAKVPPHPLKATVQRRFGSGIHERVIAPATPATVASLAAESQIGLTIRFVRAFTINQS